MKRIFKEPTSGKIDRVSLVKGLGYPADHIVDSKHALLYLWEGGFYKLGELSTLSGTLTDVEEAEKSYAGGKRCSKHRKTLLAFFLIEKTKGNSGRGYDNDVHEYINTHSGKIGFRCATKATAKEDENNEELIGYDHTKHFTNLLNALRDFFGGELNYREQFALRGGQKSTQATVFNETENVLRTYYRALLNAHTAFGKSTIAPAMATRLCEVGAVCLFTSPVTDTIIDMVKKALKYFYGKNITCITDKHIKEGNVLEQIEKARMTSIVLICVSVQNVRWADVNAEGMLRKKFAFLMEINGGLSVWFRDEYHMQYNGLVTAQVFKEIQAKYTLDLTATVYKLLTTYDGYTDPKMVIRCDNLWALREKKRGNPDYQQYPSLYIACVAFDVLLPTDVRSVYAQEEEGYREKKLFEMQGGKFVRMGDIFSTCKHLLDGEVWSGKRWVSKISIKGPINDPDLSFNKVGIVRIPEGNDGNSAKKKLTVLKKELAGIKHSLIKTADDFLKEKNKHPRGGEGVINDWLLEAKYAGKLMVVILTHEQLGVGTDIPQASWAILFDRITGIDPFIQFSGRLQRWYAGKEVVKIYALAPGMSLGISAQLQDLSRELTTTAADAKEMYDCVSLTQYLDSGFVTVSFSEATKNNDVLLNRHINNTGDICHQMFGRFDGFGAYLAEGGALGESLKDGVVRVKDNINPNSGGSTYQIPATISKGETTENENEPNVKVSKHYLATLSVMLRCVPMLYFTEKVEKLEDIWYTKLAKRWFTERQLAMANRAMTFAPAKPGLCDWFTQEKIRINGRTPQENILAGDVFRDESFLVSTGTKFLPVDWSNTELISHITKKKAFVVFNALNGVLPCLLQKAHPLAKIICIEADGMDFFTTCLTAMGFEVYTYNQINNIIVKDINGKLIDRKDIEVVMNPPYNANLDLKFLAAAVKLADHIVCVHPAISTISRKDTARYVEHTKLFDGHVSYIKMFNGNPVFGIELLYPCEIIDIDMGKTFKEIEVVYDMNGEMPETHTFKSLFDVIKWGNVPEYYSLEKKVLVYCKTKDNMENHLDKEEGKWIVNVTGIRGHAGNLYGTKMFGDDFFTFVPSSRTIETEKTGGHSMFFSSKTATEATNFLAYLKTPFSRFCLSILKQNNHLNAGELAGVPYMPTYMHIWSDVQISEELGGITEAEWAFINKVIPKYYT